MADGLFGGQVNDEFLPVDEAFRLSHTTPSANEIKLLWNIEPGYYLYKKRVKVESDSSAVSIGDIQLPTGKLEHDEFFGDLEIFEDILEITVPLSSTKTSFKMDVGYQGCAHAGLCYPPTVKTLDIVAEISGSSRAAMAVGSALLVPVLETVANKAALSAELSQAPRPVSKSAIMAIQ